MPKVVILQTNSAGSGNPVTYKMILLVTLINGFQLSAVLANVTKSSSKQDVFLSPWKMFCKTFVNFCTFMYKFYFPFTKLFFINFIQKKRFWYKLSLLTEWHESFKMLMICPLETRCQLKVHKTLRRHPERLLNLFTSCVQRLLILKFELSNSVYLTL